MVQVEILRKFLILLSNVVEVAFELDFKVATTYSKFEPLLFRQRSPFLGGLRFIALFPVYRREFDSHTAPAFVPGGRQLF